MKEKIISATKTTVSTLGVIVGIAGIEHGVGEILQGNIAPSAIVIESWPNSDLYNVLRGEPAMTIITNLLITGILAIMISVLLMIWAIKFIENKHGSLVLFLLSIFLLLFGGGFGPPLIGFIISIAGTKINSQFKWINKHISIKKKIKLQYIWQILYISCVIGFFSLWPGLIILVHFIGDIDPSIVGFLSLFSFVTLLLTIFSGLICDSLNENKEKLQGKN